MKKKDFHINGFTLPETLLVAFLLAVLALSIVILVPGILRKARDARRKSDLYKIGLAMEDYFDFSGRFPASLPDCGKPLTIAGSAVIPVVPCDPTTGIGYIYNTNQLGTFYKIYTNLERLDDPVIGQIGCQNGCGPQCQYNYGVSSTNINIDRCLQGPVAPGIGDGFEVSPPTYACSPGAASKCEEYDDPVRSECPKTYLSDDCDNECIYKENRCKNSPGKDMGN